MVLVPGWNLKHPGVSSITSGKILGFQKGIPLPGLPTARVRGDINLGEMGVPGYRLQLELRHQPSATSVSSLSPSPRPRKKVIGAKKPRIQVGF